MKITLYSDKTLDLDLQCIADNVSRLAPDLTVVTGRAPFRLTTDVVSSPDSYKRLSKEILTESANSDLVILFTEHPYDNNYFWEGVGNKSIISFWAWEHLTTISRNNGAVFFLCAILMHEHDIGVRHDDNTGCINDFWMDKTGVDLGMRSGSVCPTCLSQFRSDGNQAHAGILAQLQTLLNDISAASRTDLDICDYWRMRAADGHFDVFLCHNSHDKDAVRDMNAKLQGRKIKTWFDEEQLPPGRMWQELLEEQIQQIKTAAIFVGESGLGPWQDVELRAFLTEFVKRRCPVIPVILAQCTTVPQLPLFLKQFTWVDFRKPKPNPFGQLLWGITGKRQ
ncbi:MAG: toll/interleukin-1 receptor domain-containing protein [Verrucomicrobia bacterium]|nr:toll/interleukin-1 receptor domain-containing protein [Verrucomicrobiota bacterium]